MTSAGADAAAKSTKMEHNVRTGLILATGAEDFVGDQGVGSVAADYCGGSPAPLSLPSPRSPLPTARRPRPSFIRVSALLDWTQGAFTACATPPLTGPIST